MDPDPFDGQHHFNILLQGNRGVGKTSLILRYTVDVFGISPSLLCVPTTKTIQVGDKAIRLEMHELESEKFRTHSGQGMRYSEMDAFVIVFDLTDEESCQSVPNWIREVKNYQSFDHRNSSDALVILAGNKVDLDNLRVAGCNTPKEIAQEENLHYVEVSAKTGYNVGKMFKAIPEQIIQNKQKALRKLEAQCHVVSTARNTSQERPCCNIC